MSQTSSGECPMPDRSLESQPRAVVKGAGDMASGVALSLHRAGFAVAMTEIDRPTVVRRTVSFAQAIYEGAASVEGTEAVVVAPSGIEAVLARGTIAVVAAEDATEVLGTVRPVRTTLSF